MPARHLVDLTWPEVAAVASSTLLAVPLGATEQPGPHLPIGPDTTIATALATRLSAARPHATVAPAVASGSSAQPAGSAGTTSLGGPAPPHAVARLLRRPSPS